MSRLTIGIFTQQYGYLWSGVGTYATYLIEGLAARGHRVIVVAPQEPLRTFHKGNTPELITVPHSPYDPSIGHWFSLSLKYARLLARHPALKACDLYHFTDAREALFLPSLGTPALGTMNDYYFACASKNPLSFRSSYKDWVRRYCYYRAVHMLEPKALRKLSAVICNSFFVKEAIRREYGLPEDKLHVVYYGIAAAATGAHESVEKLEGSPSLLFVGANFQRKGLPALIEAVALLKEKYPRVKLYIAGKDANQGQMRRVCKAYGVLPHVEFLGWMDHEDVLGLYKKATLFVMPSLIEGFGFVFLEAMSAGIPVIAGDAGGTKELIHDGVNGFLVAPHDARQLYTKIALLVEDETLKRRMVQNAFATLAEFTVRRSIDDTLEVYEKVRQSR